MNPRSAYRQLTERQRRTAETRIAQLQKLLEEPALNPLVLEAITGAARRQHAENLARDAELAEVAALLGWLDLGPDLDRLAIAVAGQIRAAAAADVERLRAARDTPAALAARLAEVKARWFVADAPDVDFGPMPRPRPSRPGPARRSNGGRH